MKIINNLCVLELNGQRTVFEADAPLHFTLTDNEHLSFWTVAFNQTVSVQIDLNGRGSSCTVCAAYMGANTHKVNIKTNILHNNWTAKSYQSVKGLATDAAQLTFTGGIHIAPNAQKSEGIQNHRAIILSDKSTICATPELEIYADDVKCSHGSAIGALNKDHLFYLQSRGIDAVEAKKILIRSFFSDISAPEFNDLIEDWMDNHV